MPSEQFINLIEMLAEPAMYQDFSTATEIKHVCRQLTLGHVQSNREKYVLSCLLSGLEDAFEISINKTADGGIRADLIELLLELKQLQLILISPDGTRH
jgi:hypothetical protein